MDIMEDNPFNIPLSGRRFPAMLSGLVKAKGSFYLRQKEFMTEILYLLLYFNDKYIPKTRLVTKLLPTNYLLQT